MKLQMPDRLTVVSDKYFYGAQRAVFRIWKKVTENPRPSSYPYLSGDSFRALADHIHDETGTFDPNVVKAGDVVFVSNPLLRSYLTGLHKDIKYPYVLIQHNGDNNIGKDIADLLDDKIVRFYAQVPIYEHPKIVPIPIGLANLHYYNNGITRIFKKLNKSLARHPDSRKNRILFLFNIGTNPGERKLAWEYFSAHPLMDTFASMISSTLYLKELIKYKFVASPPGNSIESNRTWEALYVKTVPIVKDDVPYRYLVSLGLPLWIVKDWKELGPYSDSDLSKKYEELMKNADYKALHMDFWINLIKADQETARAI
jgi:hypothetical protein